MLGFYVRAAMETKRILPALSSYFDEFKFNSSKKHWVCSKSDGVSLLIQFQKSGFGGLYFLNFGIYVAGMNPDAGGDLNIHKCQLIARYEDFFRLDTASYNKLFSTDEEGLIDRTHLIGRNTKEVVCPVMLEYNSRAAAYRILSSGPSSSMPFRITKVLREDFIKFLEK